MPTNDAPPGLSSNELAVDRTVLAVERTLMAWIRTALSMIGFGFTIFKFLTSVQGVAPEVPRDVGLFLILLGTSAAAYGCLDYWQVMRNLGRGSGTRFRWVPFTFAVLIGLLGVGLTFHVLTES